MPKLGASESFYVSKWLITTATLFELVCYPPNVNRQGCNGAQHSMH